MKTSLETQIFLTSLSAALAAISLTELIEKGGKSHTSTIVFIVAVGITVNATLHIITRAIRGR
ncbi:MAG TPA: hypothetical protein VGE31_00785 [Candidatus Paceibacterota bacterium]